MEKVFFGANSIENDIISLFFERDDKAIVKTEEQFGKLIFTICNNILANESDSEECLNSVYLRLWNTIPPKKPNSLKAYIIKIARSVSLDRLRIDRAGKRIPQGALECLDDMSDFLSDDFSLDTQIERAELTSLLNEFLSSLDKKSRVVFLKRYYFCESLTVISSQTGFSVGKIKGILKKTVSSLKTVLKEKGVYYDK